MYSRDAVALLLGDSYHPGGAALTRELADQLGLRSAGERRRVADIASGPGATARLLAGEYNVTVDGVDISEINVNRARVAVAQSGLSRQVRFHHGDAEELPLPDNTFDALTRAGLHTRHVESHDYSLLHMIDRIDARITALRIAAPTVLADNGVAPDSVLAFTVLAREAVKAGRIGYTLIIAEKAGPAATAT